MTPLDAGRDPITTFGPFAVLVLAGIIVVAVIVYVIIRVLKQR